MRADDGINARFNVAMLDKDNGEVNSVAECSHSVFQVTFLRTGMVYIADLSIEQFGIDEEEWWLPKAVYLERYVKGEVGLRAMTREERRYLQTMAYDREWLDEVARFCDQELDVWAMGGLERGRLSEVVVERVGGDEALLQTALDRGSHM